MIPQSIIIAVVAVVVLGVGFFVSWKVIQASLRKRKNLERALKMVPLMIHLPPSTDDIQGGGRDERDVVNEQLSEAQVMYGIISSTLKKGFISKLYGQRQISFEIVANNGFINYYAIVPISLVETIRQAITAAYPTARLEMVDDPNFFSKEGGIDAVVGGELRLKKEPGYPIATYEDTKRDASLALINALSTAHEGDGIGIQILIRPTDGSWTQNSLQKVKNIKDGTKSGEGFGKAAQFAGDFAKALWEAPKEREQKNDKDPLTNLQQDEITRLEEKTKHPGFEARIRVIASSSSSARSEALMGAVLPVFSQFELQGYNGFTFNQQSRMTEFVRAYIMRDFPQNDHSVILNSVELASIFHLPSQNSIPTSQVERQRTKQVDGPTKLMDEGIILGVNEFRGEQKVIRLGTKDRQRHTYIIGGTGMGKSVLLTNLAYQDMCDGRGFCFIDPHGDAVETILSKVPPERMDDVILFEPGNLENPVGMNMFEFNSEDQKDFIVQESLNMLISLYDPGNQGIFGPRAQHMFRNATLLLMSDPNGGTFIDVPRCFTDPEFVKEKLKYVKDKTVFDYWTKEFPASQKSSDAGEVTSWFVSKWGPFLSNKMMRNILGQTKSGFNIREIMDNKKILLVNLAKGKTGEQNAKLLGMIFVMKFQAAAMSRADIPEEERKDFCLFVDEFQNFATDSFESILSEARKFRLNLIVVNQFMTQLTDKIREAILGNCGTIICGRIGVTDAEIMQKAFTPVFTAEDLHNQPNFHAISTVMMYNMPTSPFTMRLLPPMGDSNEELMKRMRTYALSRYGRPRAEVEAEIDARLGVSSAASAPAPEEEMAMPAAAPVAAKPIAAKQDAAKPAKKTFLDRWKEHKKEIAANPSAASAPKATPASAAAPKPVTVPKKTPAPAPAASAPATAPVSAPQMDGLKIERNRIPDLTAQPAAPAPVAQSQPEPKSQTMQVAGGGQVQNSDDGVVLRWR